MTRAVGIHDIAAIAMRRQREPAGRRLREHLEIRDEHRNVGIEHLRLEDDELPHLVHIHIAEKVRDDIK